MNELLEKYEVFSVQSYSYDESRMVAYIKQKIEKINSCRYISDNAGNLLITKGDSNLFPCYTAHLDTVHRIRDDYSLVIENGKITAITGNGRRCGVGGDDKCGIYICLRMLRELDTCKVALFSQEEIGSVGASRVDLSFFNDCSFVMTLDTPSNDDIEMTTCGVSLASSEFRDVVLPIAERFGYHYAESDAPHDGLELVERGLHISGALPSNGYYNYHQENDYTVIDDLEQSVEFCREAAKLATKKYEI
jgi:putative aminopeptidase FrvX